MGIVIGLTAQRMLESEAASIVSGEVVGGNLILTNFGGGTINAGSVAPQGLPPGGVSTQVPVKQSITDFDTSWTTLTTEMIDDTAGYKIMTAAERTAIEDLEAVMLTKQDIVAGLPGLVLVTDVAGEISTSPVTSVELGYLVGVTAPIQDQFAAKANVTRPVYNSGVTSGGYTVDQTIRNGYLITIGTLTGNVGISATNYTAGFHQVIRIVNGATLRTLTFPAFTFVGGAAPANIAASKTGVLTLVSYGTTVADTVAKWEVQS